MMKIKPSDRTSHNAGVAFFLCVFLFLVVMVLDHTAPAPGTDYLMAFAAAAAIGTLLYWWFLTRRIGKPTGR